MAVTQKEKIIQATIMAQRIRSIANRIEFDANDYGNEWPHEYVKELKELSKEFLELDKPKRKRTTSK